MKRIKKLMRRVWGLITCSFWCHDCRRLGNELEKTTRSYIRALKQIATTKQLYENDGEAIAKQLQVMTIQLSGIRRLLSKSGKKTKKKKKGQS